jgi:hypothetical protein
MYLAADYRGKVMRFQVKSGWLVSLRQSADVDL